MILFLSLSLSLYIYTKASEYNCSIFKHSLFDMQGFI